MSDRSIYAYQGAGTEFPERLRVDLRNGLLRLTMRGEPRPAEEGLLEGPTAVMTLPLQVMPQLVQALLGSPPVAAMVDKVPFVLFFDDGAQRDAFVATLRRQRPEFDEVVLG